MIRVFYNAKHLSAEYRWGYLAGKLGKDLFFEGPANMTARQVAASEVLMNLGMLASSEAVLAIARQLSQRAAELKIPDGNAGKVAKQVETEHIPTFEENIKGALTQYLSYLGTDEANPFRSLNETARPANGMAGFADCQKCWQCQRNWRKQYSI